MKMQWTQLVLHVRSLGQSIAFCGRYRNLGPFSITSWECFFEICSSSALTRERFSLLAGRCARLTVQDPRRLLEAFFVTNRFRPAPLYPNTPCRSACLALRCLWPFPVSASHGACSCRYLATSEPDQAALRRERTPRLRAK